MANFGHKPKLSGTCDHLARPSEMIDGVPRLLARLFFLANREQLPLGDDHSFVPTTHVGNQRPSLRQHEHETHATGRFGTRHTAGVALGGERQRSRPELTSGRAGQTAAAQATQTSTTTQSPLDFLDEPVPKL